MIRICSTRPVSASTRASIGCSAAVLILLFAGGCVSDVSSEYPEIVSSELYLLQPQVLWRKANGARQRQSRTL